MEQVSEDSAPDMNDLEQVVTSERDKNVDKNGNYVELDTGKEALEHIASHYSTKQVEQGLKLTPIKDSEFKLLTFDNINPCHPSDPMVFSKPKKFWMTFMAAILVLNTTIASSGPTGASTFIHDELGGFKPLILSTYMFGYVIGPFISSALCEEYGRWPIFMYGTVLYTIFSGACAGCQTFSQLMVCRFLAGAFGSVPTTNSGALCGDIWHHTQRGTAMSYYSIATFAGPAIGPIISAFVGERLTWRWVFIILTIFSAVLCFLIFFAMCETYPQILLKRLAQKLREETGDQYITSSLEYSKYLIEHSNLSHAQRVKNNLTRILATPFIILFTEVIVMFITAYMCVAYGLIYLTFESYPVVFREVHHLSISNSTFPFLGTFFGAIISVPVNLYYQKKYLRAIEKNKGVAEPEMRLEVAQTGGILLVISLFWLGWTGFKSSIPWIVPALSGILQGVGTIMIFRALQTYLIDAYERNSASATASSVCARSIFGAAFPLFASSMYHRLGVQWASTLLAGIMLLLVPVPFLFEHYGARLRKNSKWASSRG